MPKSMSNEILDFFDHSGNKVPGTLFYLGGNEADSRWWSSPPPDASLRILRRGDVHRYF